MLTMTSFDVSSPDRREYSTYGNQPTTPTPTPPLPNPDSSPRRTEGVRKQNGSIMIHNDYVSRNSHSADCFMSSPSLRVNFMIKTKSCTHSEYGAGYNRLHNVSSHFCLPCTVCVGSQRHAAYSAARGGERYPGV